LLKGRLHEIGSAGGEFSGNKIISWRFREVNFRNRLKFCRQRRVKTMASEGHVGTCSAFLQNHSSWPLNCMPCKTDFQVTTLYQQGSG